MHNAPQDGEWYFVKLLQNPIACESLHKNLTKIFMAFPVKCWLLDGESG